MRSRERMAKLLEENTMPAIDQEQRDTATMWLWIGGIVFFLILVWGIYHPGTASYPDAPGAIFFVR